MSVQEFYDWALENDAWHKELTANLCIGGEVYKTKSLDVEAVSITEEEVVITLDS